MSQAVDTEVKMDTPPAYDPAHGKVWNFIEQTVYKVDHRQKHKVNRKKYLKLCLLGIFGAHRFYSKRYILGILYLATCWSGFSVAMTLIDAIIAIPMKPDENGDIWL